jgi:hypothetical protein
MFFRPETWKALIANHPATKATNKNFHLIDQAFNKDKSIMECTNAALGIQPGIFLAMPIDSKKPFLFHHFNKAFRNPGDCHDVDEFYGIISWDDLPLAIKVDPMTLFAHAGDGTLDDAGLLKTYFTNVNTNQLFAAKDPEAFEAIQEDEQGDKLYLRRCIPVPPFIALMMVDSKATDAHQLGAEVVSLIGSIEDEVDHELHSRVTSIEGRLALRNILTWLFKAQNNMDLRIICNQVFPGSKIDTIARALRSEKISIQNKAESSSRIDENGKDLIIQSNLAVMQELIESQRKSQDKTEASGDKGFQKLPSALKAFLLAVGSQDLESPCTKISSKGLELLKMPNKHAIDELSRLLKKERQEDTNLEVAHLTEIISIKWFSSHSPFIGLSLCRMPPASKFSAASSFEKVEKLELMKELEIEKGEILSTMTDRSLFRPLSIDDLLSNVSVIQGILEIYVGAESVIAQKVADFHFAIRSNKSDLKLNLASDDTLLTKIQFVFDTRLNKWLGKVYENADNLLEVNHKLINFESIIDSIMYGTFSTELPPNLLPSTLAKKRAEPPGDDEKEYPKQKQRKGDVNDKIVSEFKLKDGEKWNMFTKDPNNLRPASVCMMFHILGHCPQGKNCKRAKSHGTLTAAQKEQTAAFIEDRRK